VSHRPRTKRKLAPPRWSEMPPACKLFNCHGDRLSSKVQYKVFGGIAESVVSE